MELPFTPEQFFDVFSRYNHAVWPAQIVLNILALVAVVFLIKPRANSGPMISGILAFLWGWTGIAYHLLFFAGINTAAYGFGAVFLVGSIIFLRVGVFRRNLVFDATDPTRRIVGGLLVTYGLLVYPFLSILLGHGYPAMPTFGLPCPTTIFTIGMLSFLSPPYPRYTLFAPILWALIGSQAAFILGVHQDLGLLVAAGVGVGLSIRSRRQSQG